MVEYGDTLINRNDSGIRKRPVGIIPRHIGIRWYRKRLKKIVNLFTSPLLIYSTRKFNPTYTGSALKVRRQADDLEIDIEFTQDGQIDYDALQAHVGYDIGRVWNKQTGPGANANLNNSVELSNGHILIGTSTRVYRSIDGGSTWDGGTIVTSGIFLRDIIQLNNGHILTIDGNLGYVFKSTDNGYTWDNGVLLSSNAELVSIIQLYNGHILALGASDGKFYRSLDNGGTWVADSFILSDLRDIVQLQNGQLVVTTGTNSLLYRSNDHGVNWFSTNLPADFNLENLLELNNGDLLGRYRNIVYRSLDGGSTWDAGVTVEPSLSITLSGLSQFVNGDIFLLGRFSSIYKSSGLGRVVTWYDQSRNGYHLAQSENQLQPEIFKKDGSVVIYFDGNEAKMEASIQLFTKHTINLVTSINGTGTDRGLLNYSGGGLEQSLTYTSGTILNSYFGGVDKTVTNTISPNTKTIITRVWDGKQGSLFVQGSDGTVKVGNPDNTGSTETLVIGTVDQEGEQELQEFLLYTVPLIKTDREKLEDDQKTYFGIV